MDARGPTPKCPQQQRAARPLSKSRSPGPPKQDQEHAEAQDQGDRRGRPWARRLVLGPGLGEPLDTSNDREPSRDRQVPLRWLWKRVPGPSEPPQCDCFTVGDVSVCFSRPWRVVCPRASGQRQSAPQQRWALRPLCKSRSPGPPKHAQEDTVAEFQEAMHGLYRSGGVP